MYAQNSMEDVKLALSDKKYEDARDYADILIQDSLQKNNSEAWFYRGYAHYMMLSNLQGIDVSTDSLALFKAYQSYLTAIELKSNAYADSAKIALGSLQKTAINFAGRYYKEAESLVKGNLSGKTYYKKAFEAAQIARKIHPTDTLAYSLEAYSALALQDFEGYEQTSLQLIKILPKNRRLRHYEALMKVYRDVMVDTAKVIEILDKALSDFPTHEKFKQERKNIHVKHDNAEKLITEAQQEVLESPQNPMKYFQLALLYQKYEYIEEAILNYQKCIDIDPSNANAYYMLGGIYYNKGAESLKSVDDISFTEYHQNRKEIEKEARDNFEKARPYFETLLHFQPDNPSILNPLYQIYKHLSLKDKANALAEKLSHQHK
jgi:tetratricopeptide (TPR) repeat protein